MKWLVLIAMTRITRLRAAAAWLREFDSLQIQWPCVSMEEKRLPMPKSDGLLLCRRIAEPNLRVVGVQARPATNQNLL